MLPLLRLAADAKERSLAEARDVLADEFGLSQAERDELLPTGRRLFGNRVAWAKFYLQRAGLLSAPRRGHFQVADRGREVLKDPPERIDVKFLTQITPKEDGVGEEPLEETPEEALEAAHRKIRAALVSEVLERVKASSDKFFQRLVVDLLLKMGYGGSGADAGQVVGKPGDEGIDGIISEDRLGLEVVYLQAKKWDGSVGRPEVQRFVGALHGKRARKGVFITTGAFTADARAFVEHIDPKVVLIDGKRLAEFMIDFEVGFVTTRTYRVKRVDSDYFDEA